MAGIFASRGRTSAARTSGNYASSKGTSPSKQKTSKGLFTNNIWHCDCRPRLPAEHFQTKKQNDNYGRWFYTCQKPKGVENCGFFLWEDEARTREESAVLGASHSEASVQPNSDATHNHAPSINNEIINDNETDAGYETAREKWAKPQPSSYHPRDMVGSEFPMSGGNLGLFPKTPSKPRAAPPTVHSSNAISPPDPVDRTKQTRSPKRKLPWLARSDSDDYGTDAFDGESGAEEALEAVQQAEKNALPETPKKIQKTSQTNSSGLLTPDTTPHKPHISPKKTEAVPSPFRPREDLNTAYQSIISKHNLTIPSAVSEDLKSLFTRYEAQYQGAVKGRDIARAALSSRQETITTQEATIATHEKTIRAREEENVKQCGTIMHFQEECAKLRAQRVSEVGIWKDDKEQLRKERMKNRGGTSIV